MSSEREKPQMIRVRIVNDDGTFEEKTVRADEVRTQGTPQTVLTDEQKARARELWKRVGRAARPEIGVQGWVDGFSRDMHPDSEMDVWDHIAKVTDDLWQQGVGKTRDQLLRTVMAISIRAVDIPSQIPGVTDAMVEKVRQRWAQDDS